MKRKKFLALCLCFGLLLCGVCSAAAGSGETQISFTIGSGEIHINGKTIWTEPSFTKDGTVLVPVRVITEAFGADVVWMEQSQSVSISLDGNSILLMIGDRSCLVGGESKTLPTAPVLVRGTTMVPLRFISETFGAHVAYDETGGHVTVVYSLAPQGTRTRSAFGMQLAIPEGWTQVASGANRLLLEKYYADGIREFILVLAAGTDCDAQEWLDREITFLQAQYGKERFQSKSGSYSDASGVWTTLSATVDYSAWQTYLRERYLPGSEFSYFVRYGRLTPSPADTDGGSDPLATEMAARGAQSQLPAGKEPAWTEMEGILNTLSVSEPTQASILKAFPSWNASQNIFNKYDGWKMNLPESFQTLRLEENCALYEQRPDGIRLAVARDNGRCIQFSNIVPFTISLYEGAKMEKENYYDYNEAIYLRNALGNKTRMQLQGTGNFVHCETMTPPYKYKRFEQEKEAMCIQKDTMRYHTLNYALRNKFVAQILMPEETSNWLDMNRVYQSLQTFYSEPDYQYDPNDCSEPDGCSEDR